MTPEFETGFELLVLVLAACSSSDDSELNNDGEMQDCTNTTSIFTINLDPTQCNVDIEDELNTTSLYQETINGTTRTISVNGIVGHDVGVFPNSGNPNTIAVVNQTFSTTTNRFSRVRLIDDIMRMHALRSAESKTIS